MFRIKGDPIIKGKIKAFTAASTGGNINSSDIGSILVYSSGNVAINHPSTDIFALTTAGTLVPVAGILDSLDPDSSGSVGISSTRYWVSIQPIAAGEVLEADYTTATAFWTQANEFLATTNMGKYLRVCGAGSSSAVSAVNGVLEQGQYIDVSTGASALASSFPFKMIAYSTKQKTVDVVFMRNSSADILSQY